MAAKEMSSPVRCICIIMAGPRQVKKCASTAGASVVLLLRCRCRCHLSTTPGLHVVQCVDESHLVVGWRRVPFFRLGLELPLDPCGLVWLHRKSSHAAGTRARGSMHLARYGPGQVQITAGCRQLLSSVRHKTGWKHMCRLHVG